MAQTCPPTACHPSPCTPYCIPPPPCIPSCYLPAPCLPYPPPCTAPPQICYPPACPPQPCTPCRPCTPCPPPQCCPPPSCRQQCPPKQGCCGGGGGRCGGGGGGCGARSNCCCSGGPAIKPIVCIPIRVQAQACGSVRCGRRAPSKRPHQSSAVAKTDQQQASYNNCNFYMTEIPEALRDQFCLSQSEADTECTEEDETEECTDETDELCTSASNMDDEYEDCEEVNAYDDCGGAAGNAKQICQPLCPPFNCFGFPNLWAACFPGLANCFPDCGGFPFGQLQGGMFPGGRGRGGIGIRGGGGRGRGRGRGGMNRGGRGTGRGRGGDPCAPGGPGRRDPYRSASRRGGSYGPPGGRGESTGLGKDPYGTAGYEENPYGPTGRGNGNDGGDDYDRNTTMHPSQATSRASGVGKYKSGLTSKIFSRTAGYRPYSYSNAELTKKSDAYLNPSRSTMKPSCSTIASTKHAQTSYHNIGGPSKFNHTAVGPSRSMMLPSQSQKSCIDPDPCQSKMTNRGGMGPSRSMTTIPNQSGGVSRSNFFNGGASRARSEPNMGHTLGDDQETLIPVYRTTTQTRLQILERPNEPSEIRVIQRPVQEVVSYQRMEPQPEHSRINLDVVTEDLTKKKKRKKKPFDPCHPRRQCIKYHTRRLHRLCSFTNRRKRRLSQIHKPLFCFAQPPCPIRETVASILRKHPPARCGYHEQKEPAFHEYCLNDGCPETNRYPLLTREFSPLCHDPDHQQPHVDQNHNNPIDAHHKTHVEKRGAKRKLHHR